MGVGAAFDVNIGTIPRAPRLMTRLGLEWLYRLIQEPRRLRARYAQVVPRFLAIVAFDRARRAKHVPAPGRGALGLRPGAPQPAAGVSAAR